MKKRIQYGETRTYINGEYSNSSFDHTPGKWQIGKCPCDHDMCDIYTTSNGRFYQGSGYSKADARLIAHAPDMLNILIKNVFTGYLNGKKTYNAEMRDIIESATGKTIDEVV